MLNGGELIDSVIIIKGNNNNVTIEKGVKLRKAKIIIRGENCSLTIGEETTFGGIRIVNVGKNNAITIGNKCLFADNVEIWASDTHSIYDINGNFINPELPVTIGDNVWIGSNVKILKGVSISDGAIVGMNTLVTKNIAGRTLNIGSPNRCIREEVSWTLKYDNELV